VIGGLEGRSFCMTKFATKGRVDFVVADQAIGHLRKVRFGEGCLLFHAAMTGAAGVGGVEMASDIAHRREVSLRVDRGANNGRDIPERQVLLVIEARQQSRPRLSDTHLVFLVADQAD